MTAAYVYNSDNQTVIKDLHATTNITITDQNKCTKSPSESFSQCQPLLSALLLYTPACPRIKHNSTNIRVEYQRYHEPIPDHAETVPRGTVAQVTPAGPDQVTCQFSAFSLATGLVVVDVRFEDGLFMTGSELCQRIPATELRGWSRGGSVPAGQHRELPDTYAGTFLFFIAI